MDTTVRKQISRIAHLERRHSDLKQQVRALDGQRHLSTEQQILVATLKKEKLATKDELTSLRTG